MIDLSDGLAGDLRHLLKASQVGAEILASAIPISPAARLRAKADGQAKVPLLAALTDGEDFELLFAAPSRVAVSLLDGWKKTFPKTPLSCIGKLSDTPGRLLLRSKDGVRCLSEHGYVHFQ
jgi:thiamine-monophosphate kinase